MDAVHFWPVVRASAPFFGFLHFGNGKTVADPSRILSVILGFRETVLNLFWNRAYPHGKHNGCRIVRRIAKF